VLLQEALISALGSSRPPIAGMKETATKNIFSATQKFCIRRFISTTGEGVRNPQDQPELIDYLMKVLLTLLVIW